MLNSYEFNDRAYLDDFSEKQWNILSFLINGSSWARKIYDELGDPSLATVSKNLKKFKNLNLVSDKKVGKKMIYSLTEKGRSACIKYEIKREAGLIGINWAGSLYDKGYKIRFLDDLTGVVKHKKKLFAWNPKTKDVKLAHLFDVREVPSFYGFFIDVRRDVKKPIRMTKFHENISKQVSDMNNEKQIQQFLKNFFDLNRNIKTISDIKRVATVTAIPSLTNGGSKIKRML